MFTESEDENTGAPPIPISPDVGFSSPAIARKVVVLPHPDGPSRVRCSPAPTRNVTPRTPKTLPNHTTTARTAIDARAMLTPLRDGPPGEAPRVGARAARQRPGGGTA